MLIWFKERARLLFIVIGGLILLSDNALDFHDEMWSLLPIFLKHLNLSRSAEVLDNFEFHHLQNDFYHQNNLNQILEFLLFFLALYYFILIIVSKSVLFMNPEISDLLTIFLIFYLYIKDFIRKIIKLHVEKNLLSRSFIFALKSFLRNQQDHFLLTKFACFNLAEKFAAVNLLNSSVLVYL